MIHIVLLHNSNLLNMQEPQVQKYLVCQFLKHREIYSNCQHILLCEFVAYRYIGIKGTSPGWTGFESVLKKVENGLNECAERLKASEEIQIIRQRMLISEIRNFKKHRLAGNSVEFRSLKELNRWHASQNN